MKKKNPKVSLIIPCYGASNTLKCLAMDLLRQTYSDFEAIFVNDGDDSQNNILKDIENMDCRFKIVNKRNGGVSSARNAGLEIAKGEYIVFADADDNLENNVIKILVSNIGEADIVIGGYITNYFANDIKTIVPIDIEGVVDIRHAISYIESNTFLRATWSKLFERRIIETYKIRFNEEFCIAEDWIFILEYLQHVNNVSFISNSGYIYNIGQNGNLSSKYDKNHVKVTKCWIDKLSKIWRKAGMAEDSINVKKNEYYGKLCFSMLKNLYCTKNNPSFKKSVKIIKMQLLHDQEMIYALYTNKLSKKTDIIQKYIINTKNAFLIASLHYILYRIKDYSRN